MVSYNKILIRILIHIIVTVPYSATSRTSFWMLEESTMKMMPRAIFFTLSNEV